MLARLALGNVRKSLADFGIYFLTVMLGVAVFYAFNSMTAQQGVLAFSETQSKMFDLLGMVIGGVSVFIAFVLVFLVVYANSFLIKRRKREFGVYLALGMSTGDVVKIVALESLIAGAASLAAGLVVGIGLSQLLLQLTSALFQADVAEAGGFAFVFSADALAKTAIVFAAIFLTAALLNARTVARAKLIDLLHAQRKNEEMRLTSLPLSLALFAASLVLIGVSYKLLIDNGLMEPSPEFAAATLLVCAGTVLFFYALSGFLLKLVQLIKPLYLRGLNMFALRQLNAKVNTAFASLSVVCLVLFLASATPSTARWTRAPATAPACPRRSARTTPRRAISLPNWVNSGPSPSGRATIWPRGCARAWRPWARATSMRRRPARRRSTFWSIRPTAS